MFRFKKQQATYRQPPRFIVHQPYDKTDAILNERSAAFHVSVQIQLDDFRIGHAFRMLLLQVVQYPVANSAPQASSHGQHRTQMRSLGADGLVGLHETEEVALLASARLEPVQIPLLH